MTVYQGRIKELVFDVILVIGALLLSMAAFAMIIATPIAIVGGLVWVVIYVLQGMGIL